MRECHRRTTLERLILDIGIESEGGAVRIERCMMFVYDSPQALFFTLIQKISTESYSDLSLWAMNCSL